jgi:hypothetical protein
MKTRLLFRIFILLLIATATASLLVFPFTTFAATGAADCGYGIQVTLSGYSVTCIDGMGCVASDKNGNPTGFIQCPRLSPIADAPLPDGSIITE